MSPALQVDSLPAEPPGKPPPQINNSKSKKAAHGPLLIFGKGTKNAQQEKDSLQKLVLGKLDKTGYPYTELRLVPYPTSYKH